MLSEAVLSGELTPGKTILDATSGNAGIAYAMIGAALGYKVAPVIGVSKLAGGVAGAVMGTVEAIASQQNQFGDDLDNTDLIFLIGAKLYLTHVYLHQLLQILLFLEMPYYDFTFVFSGS